MDLMREWLQSFVDALEVVITYGLIFGGGWLIARQQELNADIEARLTALESSQQKPRCEKTDGWYSEL